LPLVLDLYLEHLLHRLKRRNQRRQKKKRQKKHRTRKIPSLKAHSLLPAQFLLQEEASSVRHLQLQLLYLEESTLSLKSRQTPIKRNLNKSQLKQVSLVLHYLQHQPEVSLALSQKLKNQLLLQRKKRRRQHPFLNHPR
jgi:hypothetical protein